MKIKLGIILFLIAIAIAVAPQANTIPNLTIEIDNHTTGFNGYVVPLNFVIDYYFYELKGNETQNYVQEMLYELNELYFNSSIPLFFELDNFEIFENQATNDATFTYTETGFGIDAADLLSSFTTYVNSNATYNNDEFHQLVSGKDFENGTIGLAWLGDVGSPLDSIVQFTFDDIGFDAVLSAHEIGHNLGAEHDPFDPEANCENVSIMYPCINFGNPATNFSDGSFNAITNYLQSGRFDSFIYNTVPDIQDVLDYEVEKVIGVEASISWTVGNDIPGYYYLYENGVPISSFVYYTSNLIQHSFSINELAVFNLTLILYDAVGHMVSDQAIVTITGDLTPIIEPLNQPTTLLDNETAFLLLNITDNGNTSRLEFYQNNQLLFGLNFTKSYVLNHTISEYEPGTYNFTVLVYDEFNQIATFTSIVTVEAAPEPTINTSEESTSLSESSTNSDDTVSSSESGLPGLDILGELPVNNNWVIIGLVAGVILITERRKITNNHVQ